MAESSTKNNAALSNEEIGRYSRQLILPEIGIQGQLKLKQASVLIVGAGGLGCPAAVYLAAAGVGTLGIVDYDNVEKSNLHRQILHSEEKVGTPKADSLVASVKCLNSNVKCEVHKVLLNSKTAKDIITKYDVVIDATDNVPTRYLLSDACVLYKCPLVSGSALRFEGQLTVYNYGSGPCYRCLYPEPPPAETVTNCSDGGVLGVVPGIIGSLQALEAIKIILNLPLSYLQKLLLFDGLTGKFRVISLRGKQATCPACGQNPTITSLIDYEEFCGSRATDSNEMIEIIPESERITCKEYKTIMEQNKPHLLLDVRSAVEHDICCLPNSYNIPFTELSKKLDIIREKLSTVSSNSDRKTVFVVCRRGNDSQRAVQLLQATFPDTMFQDLKGGLHAWSQEVDPDFPVY